MRAEKISVQLSHQSESGHRAPQSQLERYRYQLYSIPIRTNTQFHEHEDRYTAFRNSYPQDTDLYSQLKGRQLLYNQAFRSSYHLL